MSDSDSMVEEDKITEGSRGLRDGSKKAMKAKMAMKA